MNSFLPFCRLSEEKRPQTLFPKAAALSSLS
jgi:hypothetical protein